MARKTIPGRAIPAKGGGDESAQMPSQAGIHVSLSKWIGLSVAALTFGASLIMGLHFFVSGDIRALQVSLENETKKTDTQKADYDKRLSEQAQEIEETKKMLRDELVKLLEKAYGSPNGSAAKPVSMTKRLGMTRDLLAIADRGNISIDRNLVRKIGGNLGNAPREDERDPSYWKAVSQVINYRSRQDIGFSPKNLPRCSETIPSVGQMEIPFPMSMQNGHYVLGLGSVIRISNFTFHNCELDISTAQSLDPKFLIGVEHYNITYDHCVARYSGGPTNLTASTFNNCVFVFSIESSPISPRLNDLTRQLLLASDIAKVELRG